MPNEFNFSSQLTIDTNPNDPIGINMSVGRAGQLEDVAGGGPLKYARGTISADTNPTSIPAGDVTTIRYIWLRNQGITADNLYLTINAGVEQVVELEPGQEAVIPCGTSLNSPELRASATTQEVEYLLAGI